MKDKCALYVRISRETEASTSPERQEAACRAAAAQRGWEVVEVFSDLDVSGYSTTEATRPALGRLLKAMDRGEFGAVVFWRVDRLARNVATFYRLAQRAEAAGVALVSATEPIDMSTAMGRALVGVIAVFAELESATISARVRGSIEHLAKVGRWKGGRRPYGWQPEALPGGGFRLALDPTEAAVVQQMVDAILSGDSVLTVAERLSTAGVTPPDGRDGHWHPISIARMLRNPVMAGHTTHLGQVVRGEDGRPLEAHEALVDAQTFQRLQEMLDGRAKPKGRARQTSPLLFGLAICGECGESLHSRKSSTGVDAYACSGRARGKGKESCPGVAVSMARLDEYVVAEFLEAVGRFPVVVEVLGEVDTVRGELEEARAALVSLEEDRYLRGLFRSGPDLERFVQFHQRLTARVEELEALVVTAAPRWERTGETFAEAFEREDTRGRRALLQSALEGIYVTKGQRGRHGLDPERVTIEWREDGPEPD